MRITAIRERTISLASRARNASIGFSGMTASALVIETDLVRGGKPVQGLAFDSIGRYGHGGLLRERFIPRLLAASPEDYLDERGDNFDPFKVFAIVMRDEKPGGHGERPGAVGLIDAAVWDLVAKLEDRPLWSLLAERFGAPSSGSVAVYATCGLYREEDDVAHLRDELRRCLDLGFTRVKIKAGAVPLAQDLRRVEQAVAILGAGSALALDCNGALPLERALELAASLAPFGLAWLEEPVEPLDFEQHKVLAAHASMPLATGENIFSAVDAANLIRYGGLRPDRDLLQMDVSLSYGIVEYLKILRHLETHGWSRRQCCPHAGHLLSLNVVAGLGLGCHEMSPFGDFALPVKDGHVVPASAPGVGFERQACLPRLFGDLLAS